MARNDGKKNKQKAKRMVVKELSGVTKPAHEGADVTLFKVADDDKLEKQVKGVLSTVSDGHQHGLFIHEYEDQLTGEVKIYDDGAGTLTYVSEHTHVYVKNEDGSISVGATYGHTHEITESMDEILAKVYGTELPDIIPSSLGSVTKTKGATTMTTEELEKKLKETTDQLAKAEALAVNMGTLTDVQKAHLATLQGDAADVFLNKTAEQRDVELDMLKSDDPVVYTAKDGTELRKSEGDAMINAIKRADILETRFEAEVEKSNMLELKKRAADELSNLPGGVDVQVALLKAVDGIADETLRKGVAEAITAANTALSSAFVTKGAVGGEPEGGLEKLDAMAKTYASEHKISFEKAFSAVIDTPEGLALYMESVS